MNVAVPALKSPRRNLGRRAAGAAAPPSPGPPGPPPAPLTTIAAAAAVAGVACAACAAIGLVARERTFRRCLPTFQLDRDRGGGALVVEEPPSLAAPPSRAAGAARAGGDYESPRATDADTIASSASTAGRAGAEPSVAAAASTRRVVSEIDSGDRQAGAEQVERTAAGPHASLAAVTSLAAGGEPTITPVALQDAVAALAADTDAAESALAAGAALRLIIREDDGATRESGVAGVAQAAASPHAGRATASATAASPIAATVRTSAVASVAAAAQATSAGNTAGAALGQVGGERGAGDHQSGTGSVEEAAACARRHQCPPPLRCRRSPARRCCWDHRWCPDRLRRYHRRRRRRRPPG